MKKHLLAQALIITSIGASPLVMADQQQEIADLRERLNKLEAEQVKHQQAKSEGESWSDKVTVSGLIEVEASYTDNDSDSSSSDLVVATAEIGIEANITENVSSVITLLHEEDETDLEVDVATMTYAPSNSGFSFTVGQDYVPFGQYETALVNDPLTLEIGEARETAFVVNYESGAFASALYLFNGDQDEDDRDTLQNVGARFALSGESYTVGLDYVSNLADSDGLQDNDYGYAAGEDAVGGASLYAAVSFGQLNFVAEHLTALDEFKNDGADSEPSASQIEAAIEVGRFTYAVSFQQTDEAAFLELPEERISLGMSTEIFGAVGLGIELQQDEDYSVADGGTGDDTTSAVIQLSVEF